MTLCAPLQHLTAYLGSALAVVLAGLIAKLLESFLPLPNRSIVFLTSVLGAIVTQVKHILNAQVVIWLPDVGPLVLRVAQPSTITLTEAERAIAMWA